LLAGFNFWGALLVAVALFFHVPIHDDKLFVRRDACMGDQPERADWAVERLGILQKAQARWHAWREERETAAHAATRGRVAALRKETGAAANHWKG